MRISELITQLQTILQESGDQPVEISLLCNVNSGEYVVNVECRHFDIESVYEVIPPPAQRYTVISGEADDV